MESKEVRAQWAERVDGWRRSGLTAKQYAESIGVKTGTLSYWAYRGLADGNRERRRTADRTRYRESQLAQGQTALAGASLVEIVASPAHDERFELTLRDGRRLQIPAGFEVSSLERLLSVLEVRR
jgi:transposase